MLKKIPFKIYILWHVIKTENIKYYGKDTQKMKKKLEMTQKVYI